MSSTIWTPTAVASSASHAEVEIWRAVEAQHQVSTLALVDSLDEQKILERLLEESKPSVPAGCEGLHWLLSTPFRYHPLRTGSRFRATTDPGVFYGAEEIRTACAELGYWRWRFLLDSTLDTIEAKAQTVFSVLTAVNAIDLARAPFVEQEAVWANPNNYSGCQLLARAAREAGVTGIRYRSVRDPARGYCLAVLSPTGFKSKTPTDQQTWFLTVKRERVLWTRDFLTRTQMEFSADHW